MKFLNLFRRRSKSPKELTLENLDRENIDLFKETKKLYSSFTKEDFKFFYKDYFTFSLRASNAIELIALLKQIQFRINRNQYLDNLINSLDESLITYSNDSFFISRHINQYVNKLDTLEELTKQLLALLDLLLTNKTENNSYYKRLLKPLINELYTLALLIKEK